jgi:NAD(P)-dependent dehydrogenase (short-subunit alcohol dehydrogenase family)
MHIKTIAITGGNDGIGFATATELARQGARLFLLCRNEEKAKRAVVEIRGKTNNLSVDYILMDLLSFQSVRKAAEELRSRTDHLDVLINNAGGTFSKFELAEDGLERTVTCNHFSHFLLTALVFDLIQKSPEGRIVNVASHSHYDFNPRISLDAFTQPKGYFIMKQYAISKLANVMFTIEMAERLKAAGIKNVTVNSLHPGTVKTQIGAKDSMGRLHRWVWLFMSNITGVTLEEGAATSIYVATSPELKAVSGQYFTRYSRMGRSIGNFQTMAVNPEALKPDARKLLWNISEQYCGLRFLGE